MVSLDDITKQFILDFQQGKKEQDTFFYLLSKVTLYKYKDYLVSCSVSPDKASVIIEKEAEELFNKIANYVKGDVEVFVAYADVKPNDIESIYQRILDSREANLGRYLLEARFRSIGKE